MREDSFSASRIISTSGKDSSYAGEGTKADGTTRNSPEHDRQPTLSAMVAEYRGPPSLDNVEDRCGGRLTTRFPLLQSELLKIASGGSLLEERRL